jgi:hypothetical protein
MAKPLLRFIPLLLLIVNACESDSENTTSLDAGDASVVSHADAKDAAAVDVAASDAPSSDVRTSPAVMPNDKPKGVLRSDGSFAIFRPKKSVLAFATVESDAAAPVQGQWVQVSAPILPKVLRLYQSEGAKYPTTTEEQSKLATESALTFEELEKSCLNFTSEYNSSVANNDTQIATKYWSLEQCAYARFTAKPYWIPQLLLDVDVCQLSLGQGYRTLRESDVRAFLPGEVESFKQRLDEVNRGGGSFYFSMNVWVRSEAGKMASVDLSAGASAPITPLKQFSQNWTEKNHFEGGLALRCIRVVDSIN